MRAEGIGIAVVDVRTAKVGVLAVIVVEDTYLRGIGNVACSAAGEHVVTAIAYEVGWRLAGEWRTDADIMLRESAVGAEEIVGQLGANHFPMRTLEPDVTLARGGVAVHVEVAHAEALGLELLHQCVRTLEAVGL